MSEGPRIPLAAAQTAAATLLHRWNLTGPDAAMVVGSIRRQRPDVGDIEILTGLPTGRDWLYEQLTKDTGGDGSLFGQGGSQQFALHVQGLKPGFLAASLRVSLKVGEQQLVMPVQIYRYSTGPSTNRGWMRLMRTGPREFGMEFLARWKSRYGIYANKPASVEGNLVDAGGQIVPTPSEEEAFRLCGMGFVSPADRDGYVENLRRARAWDTKEAQR